MLVPEEPTQNSSQDLRCHWVKPATERGYDLHGK